MSRVQLIDPRNTTADRQTLLNTVQAGLGATPNLFRATANSPAALRAMWGFFGALGSASIGGRLGEQIAVAVADRNRCEYCLAAHTTLGLRAGATPAEMAAAQAGKASDPKARAALGFALKLVSERGHVGDPDVQLLRRAGFDDGAIVEIIAHVALNLFTNYLNIALAVPVDFPPVKLRSAT